MTVHRIDTDYARCEPRRVLEDALRDLPDDATAIAVFIMHGPDDRVIEETSGFAAKDVLWLLTHAQRRLIER